jgi:hypothetical protein
MNYKIRLRNFVKKSSRIFIKLMKAIRNLKTKMKYIIVILVMDVKLHQLLESVISVLNVMIMIFVLNVRTKAYIKIMWCLKSEKYRRLQSNSFVNIHLVVLFHKICLPNILQKMLKIYQIWWRKFWVNYHLLKLMLKM